MVHANGILDRVAGLAEELQLSNLVPQIAACREQLKDGGKIDVAVFGRFKAGKSSFLNHLTGRAVLPIGVVPLTAVITRLRYGPVERAEVQFLDGKRQAISLQEIGLYVGEDKNPNNAKQVAAVDVELPALKPLAPLQFIDTPGLGSSLAHNTEVALNWLPKVGAAIVAISSDAPLSERDLVLLDELRRHTPKIILLLTKADLLTEPQRAEVFTFVKQQLRLKEDSELPIYFYSIQPHLADLKVELEDNLFSPLLRHREETAGQIARHKLFSLVSQTLNYLRIALAAATQAESSREALHEKLSEERSQFDLFRSELGVLSHQWSANALDWYLSQLRSTQQGLQGNITAGLQEQFLRWKLRLPRLMEAWREWSGNFLKAELSEVSCAQKPMFCEPLHKAQAHLTRTLRAFNDRLAEHVKSAFGVALSAREVALEVREPAAPPVSVAYAFDAAFSTIGWLIPLTLFRKPIERVLLRKARYEVEKNLSRLSADWRDRVAAGIKHLVQEAERQAFDELTALGKMLEQTASKAPELKKIIDELEHFHTRLHSD